MTLSELLSEIEEAARKATPGLWTAIGPDDTPSKIGYTHPTKGWNCLFDVRGWGHFYGSGHGALGLSETDALAQQKANANHVTTCSPQNILRLIEEVRALQSK